MSGEQTRDMCWSQRQEVIGSGSTWSNWVDDSLGGNTTE